MKEFLGTFCLVVLVGFLVGVAVWFAKPQPKVAQSPIYEKASAWCEKRLAELPAGDSNRRYFELGLRDIQQRNIRWDIYAPSGLHYSLLVCWAEAWDKQSESLAAK